MTTTKILDDVTVLDLTTFVTGGFCSLMLSNQGAEVIKVERPDVGDDNRHSGPPFIDGESPYFWTVNYDKKSIELDLKHDGGRNAFYDLVSDADVVVQNFRPGTAEKLAVDYDSVREHREDIVYCTISAFGESGPWHERPGYDLLIQGMSGIMSVTGQPDEQPVKVGLPMTDLITAMWSAFGIMSALYRRERTGAGDRIELGMLDAALPWLTKQAGKVFAGESPARMGTKDPVLAPYQTFPTSDGYINIACLNQKLWRHLCQALDRPGLVEDSRFATNADRVANMAALEDELSKTLEQQTTDEWISTLTKQAGVPAAPVVDVEEALTNEQTTARGAVQTINDADRGEIPVIEHPLNFAGADSGFESPPPKLGEDTREILKNIGYSDRDIDKLSRQGVFGESEHSEVSGE
jgi:crotonobetainyl-CoA:carnitine CoA-transferase CaiB-like acyl-CoA transferase